MHCQVRIMEKPSHAGLELPRQHTSMRGGERGRGGEEGGKEGEPPQFTFLASGYATVLKFGDLFLEDFGCFVLLDFGLCHFPSSSVSLGTRSRGTARCVVSVEVFPVATQQCRNYLCDKS